MPGVKVSHEIEALGGAIANYLSYILTIADLLIVGERLFTHLWLCGLLM